MTDQKMPDPGDGRWWEVVFDDGDMHVSLMAHDPHASSYEPNTVELDRKYVRRSELLYTPHIAIEAAAVDILKNDKLRELAGIYRYTNGKLEKE